MTKKTSTRYAPVISERAVRMVLEHQSDHASQWAAIGSIAAKIGCNHARRRSGKSETPKHYRRGRLRSS